MLKTDNEPAILKLLKESLRELRVEGLEQVMSQNVHENDPQANGSAEVGVQRWKGQFKTLRWVARVVGDQCLYMAARPRVDRQ